MNAPNDLDEESSDDNTEDLDALGISVKDAEHEGDLDEVLADVPVQSSLGIGEEEPLNELDRLDKLEKELLEPPLLIGEEEEE